MFENVSEIILKVTRDCNLRCQYCYAKDKDRYKNDKMSVEIFRKLMQRVAEDKQKSIRPNSAQQLQIIFHGGEPTLLAPERLEQFIAIARQKLPSVQFGMQTNMTNLNDAWMAFFKKNHIRPGVSIDGWNEQDNTLRTNARIIDKLDLLHQAGVGYGPLMVLTKKNIKNYFPNALAIIRHARVATIKANYAENTCIPRPAYPEVTARELFQFVFKPTLEYFFTTNACIEENTYSLIRLYVESLVFTNNQKAKQRCLANCSSKFCGGGNNVIEVDPDGNVCFCGRWSDANELNTLGSIHDPDVFGLYSYVRGLHIHLQKSTVMRQKKCDRCTASAICSFGCVAFAYDKYGKVTIRNDLVCQYSKKIKKYFDRHRYEIVLRYVKSNPWELREEKDFYFLNMPITQEYLGLKIPSADRYLAWVNKDDKVYLRLDKRALKGKTIQFA